MRNYRSTLPPLDQLIFFEAAYRHCSFTGCAADLNVSQAAVSKRIRQLEDWIGEPLFVRNGKCLSVTPAGRELYQTTSMALDFLSTGIASLRHQVQKPLTIAANTVIGTLWLAPLLYTFGLSPSACPTRVITSDDPQDLFAEENDLVVAYGTGKWPGLQTAALFSEQLTPVASPEVVNRIGGFETHTFASIIQHHTRPPLLNYPCTGPDWVNWHGWFNLRPDLEISGWRLKDCDTYVQSIGLAIEGEGIALGSHRLLDQEFAAGRLRPIAEPNVATGRGYYIAMRRDAGEGSSANRLLRFLLASERQFRPE